MPIFGQVWLWSSLAFLLGALLCWALVALPARRRVGQLEAELASRGRRQAAAGPFDRRRPQDHDDTFGDTYGDDYGDERAGDRGGRRAMMPGLDRSEESAEPLTRAYAMSGTREADRPRAGSRSPFDGGLTTAPETDTELADGPGAGATQYLDVSSGSLAARSLEAPPEVPPQPEGRGWFDDEAGRQGEPLEAITLLNTPLPGGIDSRLVDDEAPEAESDQGGTVFTQRTHPIPGEVIRRIDEAGRPGAAADEPADGLVDDLGDTGQDTASRAEPTVASGPAATPEEDDDGIRQGPRVISPPKPEAEPTGTAPAHGAHGQTEVMPAHTIGSPPEVSARGRRSAADKSRRGTDEPKIMPGVTVRSEPTGNPLPKRIPSKPRGHTPFGVQTKQPEPATDAAAEPARALFEPIVPAEDAPAVPPPHRVRGEGGEGRGPFGPGSAMPLPGGASPSPEFTIKASVSALRYCTPESPQFGRTVAEVWFKTPADAERVGFRPVG